MNVDTDEFLKSLKSLQVSPCECPAKNPDSNYPNQHTKACPRFQAMHCWCPPATGPNQPHTETPTADFETKRAGILGALYDAVSVALRQVQVIDAKTRMADFASFVIAGETRLGLQPGEFMEAYNKSRASAGLSALEASPLYQPLMDFIEDRTIVTKCWSKNVYKDDMTMLLTVLVTPAALGLRISRITLAGYRSNSPISLRCCAHWASRLRFWDITR